MPLLNTHCHAKLNLYLAVTKRREDGFHDLVSLAAQISLCDELSAAPSDAGADSLACDDAALSTAPDNLVLKAAAAYRKRVPDAPFFAWNLKKCVPYGAGLGGGSSDAAGALRILNQACNGALNDAELSLTAAEVGSDCPLFLCNAPCIMRGRGEKLTSLDASAAHALKGRGVIVVKPHFGIPTGWAYGAIDAAKAFTDERKAEAELAAWLNNPGSPIPVRNSFMDIVYGKYLAYNALNDILRGKGLPELILTGSGSAAFAFAEKAEAEPIAAIADQLLGEGSFTACATLL
jgi:4-diphosphocytidyl-2-C-methyl-D-erythritol kinase